MEDSELKDKNSQILALSEQLRVTQCQLVDSHDNLVLSQQNLQALLPLADMCAALKDKIEAASKALLEPFSNPNGDPEDPPDWDELNDASSAALKILEIVK